MLHTVIITVAKSFHSDEDDTAFRDFLSRYHIDLAEKVAFSDISERDFKILLERMDEGYGGPKSISVEFDVRRR